MQLHHHSSFIIQYKYIHRHSYNSTHSFFIIAFQSNPQGFRKSILFFFFDQMASSAMSLQSLSMTPLNNLSSCNHKLHRSSLLGFSTSFQNLGISSNGPDFSSRSSSTPKNISPVRALSQNSGHTDTSRPSKLIKITSCLYI